jgi:hypothetical protein
MLDTPSSTIMAIVKQMRGGSTILTGTLKNDLYNYNSDIKLKIDAATKASPAQVKTKWDEIIKATPLYSVITKYSDKREFKAASFGNKPYEECLKIELVTKGKEVIPRCLDKKFAELTPEQQKDKSRMMFVSYLYVFNTLWNATRISKGADDKAARNFFREFIMDLFKTYVTQYNIQGAEDLSQKIPIAFQQFKNFLGSLNLSKVDPPFEGPKTIKAMKEYIPPASKYNLSLFEMLTITPENIAEFVNDPSKNYRHPSSYPTLVMVAPSRSATPTRSATPSRAATPARSAIPSRAATPARSVSPSSVKK